MAIESTVGSGIRRSVIACRLPACSKTDREGKVARGSHPACAGALRHFVD
jgi:hypothetical protein